MKNWLRVFILCCICVFTSFTFAACDTAVKAFESGKAEEPTIQNPIDNENTLPQEPNTPDNPEIIAPIEPPVVELPCEHKFGEWFSIKAPTCTEPGLKQRDCQNCAEYEQQTIDSLGHDYNLIETIEPTCTESGTQRFECKHCHNTKDKIIPATGHQHIITVIEPDCTNQGYTHHLCHCGDEYTDNEVPATGHILDENTHQCKNCDFVEIPTISPIDNMKDSYWFVTGKSKAYVIYFDKLNGNKGTYISYKAELNTDKTLKTITNVTYEYEGTFEIVGNTINFIDTTLSNDEYNGHYANYTLTYSADNDTFTLNGSYIGKNSTWIFVGYGLL